MMLPEYSELDVGHYHGAFMDLLWGEHGHSRNQLVFNHWDWLDNMKGLGASRDWCRGLIMDDGVQDDPHAHIIAAIVAKRLS